MTAAAPRKPEYCYLTTTGRRTGRPHRIEIWFGLSGDRVYLLSGGGDRNDWVRNLRQDPSVTLTIGNRELVTRARVVEGGTPEDAEARALLLAKYGGGSDGDLDEWAATALVVAVDWPPEPSPEPVGA